MEVSHPQHLPPLPLPPVPADAICQCQLPLSPSWPTLKQRGSTSCGLPHSTSRREPRARKLMGSTDVRLMSVRTSWRQREASAALSAAHPWLKQTAPHPRTQRPAAPSHLQATWHPGRLGSPARTAPGSRQSCREMQMQGRLVRHPPCCLPAPRILCPRPNTLPPPCRCKANAHALVRLQKPWVQDEHRAQVVCPPCRF